MRNSSIAIRNPQIIRKDGQYSVNPEIRKNQQNLLQGWDIAAKNIADRSAETTIREPQKSTGTTTSQPIDLEQFRKNVVQDIELPKNFQVPGRSQTQAPISQSVSLLPDIGQIARPTSLFNTTWGSNHVEIPNYYPLSIPTRLPIPPIHRTPFAPLSTIPEGAVVLPNGQISIPEGSLCKLDTEILASMKSNGYDIPDIQPASKGDKEIFVTPEKMNEVIQTCPNFTMGYVISDIPRKESKRQKYEREHLVV